MPPGALERFWPADVSPASRGRAAGGKPGEGGIAWSIEEPLLARLAALYEEHIGSLELLLAGIDGAPPRRDLLTADPLRVPLPKLRHARALMVTELARHLARSDNREVFGARDWRVLIYVVLGAGPLRYALMRLSECFESMNGRLGSIALDVDGTRAVIRMESHRAAPSALGCAIDLYGVARMHGLFGTLIDRPIPMAALALDYEPHIYDMLRLPQMPDAFHLGQGWTGFVFPAAYLDFPLICTEERLTDWTRHSFMGTPVSSSSGADLVERVRRMILSSLRDRRRLPLLAEAAAHFGMSPATMRRKLSGSGASFREMRDSCRREVALRLLQRDDVSIESIAEQLDFCDSDAFRSAFKTWIGTSPTAFRRYGLGEDHLPSEAGLAPPPDDRV